MNWFSTVTCLIDGKASTGYLSIPGDAGETVCLRYGNARAFADVPAMDAYHLLTRALAHERQNTDGQLDRALAAKVAAIQPAWAENGPDFKHWFMASQALYLNAAGFDHWRGWQDTTITRTLIINQRGFHPKDLQKFGPPVADSSDGESQGRWLLDEHGSWDPIDAWGEAGGRVWSTAINCLTLQTPSRYVREAHSGD